MRKASIVFAILGATCICGAPLPGQAQSSSSSVSRTTKAVNYRRAGGSTRVTLQGTELMQQASGEAKVDSKSNRMEIDARFENLEEATKFGLEYLTYVFWAVSPQGRAVNLGEVAIKNGAGRVKAITDLQTFGLIVTAEPYFAVTQPGNTVVLENVLGPQTQGRVENIDAKFELLARGTYSSSNTKIENAIFGIDRRTPTELFEARNAVRIAHIAQADKYAASTVAKAEQQLKAAEDAYRGGRDRKTVEAAAREVVETAEEARVMAVRQKAEEDANAKAAADKRAAEEREAKARADALAEAQRRQEAEQARLQAENAKADAERMKQEAEKAAQDAGRQKQEADQATAAALAQQKAAQADAEKSRLAAEEAAQEKAEALAQRQAAEAEAEKARQAAARAESEKAELRAQLLNQLNSILQTRDSARGLIVNMSDVLFDTGSYTLRPGAREKLAKISGIVLAHPGLNLQVEGHTDSVGSDEFNQQLSERRAGSVRDFLVDQGVPSAAVTSRGFGKTQPVATNDTPEGRQRNRRVELVVNGEAIGSATASGNR
ncbi:MAG TPA: OmpA family protein [Candidatus Acidoferrales bacterium]|nr:OmpA family protein [Candidatus Acidoferrales bacterium]